MPKHLIALKSNFYRLDLRAFFILFSHVSEDRRKSKSAVICRICVISVPMKIFYKTAFLYKSSRKVESAQLEKSVGVKDESRYEGWPAIIRAVNTKDAMTATIEEIPYEILHKITYRITHEVEGINRVLMDLTPKPTGTIEWE